MPVSSTRSQTLDRGLSVLEIVTAARTPLSISQLSERSGLHRSIVYRLLRTLEDHRLVARDAADRFGPGTGLLSLATHVSEDLAGLATPALQQLADDTDLAAFVAIREGDEAATVLVVEPTVPSVTFTHRIGSRHALDIGAPGHALRSFDPPSPADHHEAQRARLEGWATSTGEVFAGISCVAAPIAGYRVPAAVAVAFVGERPLATLGQYVVAAARDITAQLSN